MSVGAVKKYKDKIVLGADSQMTTGWQTKTECTKIFKLNNNFGFALSGYGKDIGLFYSFSQINLINPANRLEDIYDYMIKYATYVKEKTGVWGNESHFLIVNSGKVFNCIGNDDMSEVTDYETIGSGKDFAKTALYFGKTIKESIKVACDMTIFCAEPIIVHEFKIK